MTLGLRFRVSGSRFWFSAFRGLGFSSFFFGSWRGKLRIAKVQHRHPTRLATSDTKSRHRAGHPAWKSCTHRLQRTEAFQPHPESETGDLKPQPQNPAAPEASPDTQKNPTIPDNPLETL